MPVRRSNAEHHCSKPKAPVGICVDLGKRLNGQGHWLDHWETEVLSVARSKELQFLVGVCHRNYEASQSTGG
ncbi:hypothetical protein [Candidatus Methylacidithermus pantelleriae]|uniref:Uncharacterized protein n=1 Tax=Candidatus Methylacidithermus pantelleriae TaxID=2744239 RepID=A0A8J2BHG3_9BACT|nr:hypothetical protein [Candidatus Methylacidithermus pantelleriae]CAF0694732.1 hypothetical protein MPNT_170049 [Candidatus Methylacidithermus pantelleriae]